MHAPTRGSRRFGAFEIDLDAGELRKRGRRIRLQEKPLRILVALLEQPGHMVARQELHERLWAGDTFVDFDHGLNNAVNRLRFALGDSAGAPRFIETVGRRGYRFIGTLQTDATGADTLAAVSLDDTRHQTAGSSTAGAAPNANADTRATVAAPPHDDDRVAAVAAQQDPPHADDTKQRSIRIATWGAVAALALVSIAIAAAQSHGARGWLKSGTATAAVDAASGIRGLAVMPLSNLSGNHADDYLAYAVTDLLTTELAKLAPLKVISRTSVMSYTPGQAPPLEDIARQLGVDTVIEGSVNRYQDRVHVNLRMVDITTDRHVWAASFEGAATDMVALHGDIVRAVRAHVERRMGDVPTRAAQRTPVNSQAYELYLKGSFEMVQGAPTSLDVAIDYFKQALAIDDTVAPAYAGIAFTRMRQDLFGDRQQYFYLSEVKDAVARALAIDPDLADAHAAAGFARRYYDWDWAGAEAEFQRAIALNPSLAIAHTEYQFMLVGLGRMDESLREARRATEVDPRAALSWVNEGRGLNAARRFDDAARALNQALQLKPEMRSAMANLVRVRIAQHRLPDARKLLERLRETPQTPALVSLSAYFEAMSGNLAEARRLITNPKLSFDKDLVMTAAVHIALGDRDRALSLLEDGVARHLVEPNIVIAPELDPIRTDPRFARMISTMRLPPEAARALVTLPWVPTNTTQ